MRKVLYGVAAVLLLVVAAAVLSPLLVDQNQVKAWLAAEVEAATGRGLVIEGDLDIALLPSPGLMARGVRLANLEGATAPDMVRLEEAGFSVAIAPLLRGKLEIESLRLVEPTIELEVLADGRANWAFAAAVASDDAGAPGRGGAIRVKRLDIENGRLTYRDARRGTLERVDVLDARLSAETLQGPFEAEGEATVRAVPLGFEVAAGRLDRGRTIPFQLLLELGDSEARLQITGTASRSGAAPQVAGKLQASGPDLAAVAAAVGGAMGGAPLAPRTLAQKFRLTAGLTASARGVFLDDITLMLGRTRAAGTLGVALDEPLRVDANLSLNRLDLDAWLESAAATTPPKAADESAPPGDLGKAIADALTLPAALQGTLQVAVEAVTFRDNVIRQVQLAAALVDGRLDVTGASALLPGSSDAHLAGTLVTVAGRPQFDGRFEAASDNLRGLLGWLGVEPDRVPVDRLHKFSLTSNLRLTPTEIQAYGVDLRLDTTRLTGAAAYALRARPAFTLDVVVDRLNLDAYLPPAEAGDDAPPAAEARPDSPRASPLAVLETFDTNVRARIESLVVNATQISGFALDAALLGGVVTVTSARVEDLAGARVELSGRARDLAAAPAFEADVVVEARDAARLLDAFGAVPPAELGELGAARAEGTLAGSVDDLAVDVALSVAEADFELGGRIAGLGTAAPRYDLELDGLHPSLIGMLGRLGVAPRPRLEAVEGPVAVSGRFEGGDGAVAVDLTVRAAEATLGLTGDLADLDTEPRLDLALHARHPSLLGLARLVGAGPPPPGFGDGPLSLDGTLVGDSATLKLALGARAAGASVALDGALQTAGPSYAVEVAASHPDLVELVRRLGVDYRPAAVNLGGVALRGALAGDATSARLDRLAGNLGPVELAGALSARWDGEVPRLAGRLDTGEVILDLFLPAAAPGGGADGGGTAPAAGPASRWSDEPIDASWLDDFDAGLEIAARGLVLRGYEVREPKLTLRLEDGVLNIDPLTGRLFDGGLSLAASLRARSPLSLRLDLDLDDGDLYEALVRSAGVDAISGRFALAGRFESTGRSQRELMAALDGNASLTARDGVVQGFDLRALSDGLGELDTISGLADLLDATMSAGATRLISLDGTFSVVDGVASTDDGRLVLDGGDGTTAGTIDLARWQVALETRLRLSDHPEVPALGIGLSGPLDDPRRELDSGELQRYLAERLGGAVAGGPMGARESGRIGGAPTAGTGEQAASSSTGDSDAGDSSAPAPRQQSPINPLDVLKQGLGGILGGTDNQ